MPRASESGKVRSRRRAPALTPEDREDQLVALAIDLAEKKLMDGTASNQIIAHYLRVGSTKERLEKEKLQKENDLLRAKTESYKSAARVEELYDKAISSMRTYRGEDSEDNYDDEDY